MESFIWIFPNSLCYFPQFTRKKRLCFFDFDIWFTHKVMGEMWMREEEIQGERELLTHIYCNISPPLPPFLIDLPLLPRIYF